jgi:hypothetical protein
VDSAGLLTPRREGTVRIEATAGGWRSAQRDVTIHLNTIGALLREDWSGGIDRHWTPFGDPRPVLDSSSGRFVAFLNNGEGSFSSGAFTRTRYPTSAGLALDTWISDSLTLDQWQMVNVTLEDGLSEVGLRQWDHTHGNIPRTTPDPPICGASYPTTEGITYGDSLRAMLGRESLSESMVVPAAFRTGAWFQVRVQILPDGRCGVAVNGVALSVSQARVIPDTAVRALIYGNSKDAKVLVGPVVIRSGVPADVDWSRPTRLVPNAPPRQLSSGSSTP